MHLPYRVLALCVLAALAAPSQAQVAVPLADGSASTFDALAAKAAQTGSVRVIVTLNVPFAPEGFQTSLAAQAQREGIQRAQASLLAGLDAPANVVAFRFTPALGVTVSGADLARLRTLPEVLNIQEDLPVPADDTRLASPMLDQSTVLVGATAAHAMGYDGTGYEVAILDTGVQSSHPFLAGKVVAQGCFSTTGTAPSVSLCPNGQASQTGTGAGVNCSATTWGSGCDHGTHVAGIAAGDQTGASGPLVGVAPGAGVVAVQVFSGFTTTANCGSAGTPCVLSYNTDQILGLEYVYDLVVNQGRNIVSANMSLGGGQNVATCDSDSRKTIIDNLLSVGVSTVISSGNNGYQNATGTPGCISTAVTVGSTTKTDGVSSFSNIAPWMDLFAPGSAITSSIPTNAYASYNGTSMAAPHVAGAFAILKQRYPTATPAELLNRLTVSGIRIAAGTPSARYPRIQIDDSFLDNPAFATATASVSATVPVGGSVSKAVTLSNTAAPGALDLQYAVTLRNVQDQTGTPVSNACTAGQELIQASRTNFTVAQAGGQELGQSFTTPCTGTLTSISPAIFAGATPGSTFTGTLRVYQGAGTTGTQLAAVPFSATNQSAEYYLQINLPTPLTVTSGQVYTWFLDLTGTGATNNTRMLFASGTNPYSGGALYFVTNGNPVPATASSANDVQFKAGFGAPSLWLSRTPATGTIGAGLSETITLSMNATGYPVGTFTGDLVVTTNDPARASVTIPVSMTVSATGVVNSLITGTSGYRFLGPPAYGVTVDDLAAQNLVRGVPGYYPSADPANLFTSYDAATSSWVVSAGTGEVLQPGLAFRWFMYDNTAGNPAISQSVKLPFTVSTTRPVNTSPVRVRLQTEGSRFNMLANPFGYDLDLTSIASWQGADNLVPGTPVWTYDEVTRAWVEGAPSVAPWQAFRVRSKGTSPNKQRVFVIPSPSTPLLAARTAPAEQIAFTLSGTDADGMAIGDRALTVSFSDEAQAAFSVEEDVEKFQVPAQAYALIGARVGGQFVGRDVRPFTHAEIPLAVEARGTESVFTLSWNASALPVGLPVVLVDLVTGEEVDVRSQSSVQFAVAPRAALADVPNADLADGAAATDRFVLRIGSGTASAEAAPSAVELTAIAPNPSSGSARVSFALPEAGAVRLSVVDVRGREVAVLVDGPLAAGRHEARLGGTLAAGVYLVRLEAAGTVVSRQAVVVR